MLTSSVMNINHQNRVLNTKKKNFFLERDIALVVTTTDKYLLERGSGGRGWGMLADWSKSARSGSDRN